MFSFSFHLPCLCAFFFVSFFFFFLEKNDREGEENWGWDGRMRNTCRRRDRGGRYDSFYSTSPRYLSGDSLHSAVEG